MRRFGRSSSALWKQRRVSSGDDFDFLVTRRAFSTTYMSTVEIVESKTRVQRI
jgi:hypothetical protein